MTVQKAALGFGLFALLSGCAQPTPPAHKLVVGVPVAIAPPPRPTTSTAPAPGDAQGLGDPQSVERRAAAQAKAIDDILAARNGTPNAVLGATPDTTTPIAPDFVPPIPVERPKLVPVTPPAEVPVAVIPTPPADEVKPSVANAAMSTTPIDQAPPRAPGPTAVRPVSTGLEQQIADKASQNPRDVAAQLDQQLLTLLRGQAVPTPQTMAGMAQDDREMLTTLMDGLSNFRAGVAADSNMLMTRKIRPLTDMTDRMRSESDLTLPTALLCNEVTGFGSYKSIDPARFPAMTAVSVVVYCEVGNFMSNIDDKNLYTTKLHQELVLYTESGLAVKTLSRSDVKDLCRNRRHDFFLATKVQLPATLSTGRHVIKVSVVDQNANHVAETTIPLSIVAN